MKDKSKTFRDYEKSSKHVKNTYQNMQENQNLFFVEKMKKKYTTKAGFTNHSGQKIRKRFHEVFRELDMLIDESDPDTDMPQIFHAYQTGEALKTFLNQNDLTQLKTDISIRKLFSNDEWNSLPNEYQEKFSSSNLHQLYPHIKDWSWLPLIGFLHDLGKVLATKDWGALPQWAVVGDTFPIGAPFAEANVFAECNYFANNPDLNKKNMNNETFGIYKRNCGFNNLKMTFGHDEYFYSILKRTPNNLPEEALYIVHFHSFYPWHTPRNGNRSYEELASVQDWMLLPLLKVFQQSDLYSKKTALPDPNALKIYYFELLERFVPGRNPTNYYLRPAKILW